MLRALLSAASRAYSYKYCRGPNVILYESGSIIYRLLEDRKGQVAKPVGLSASTGTKNEDTLPRVEGNVCS